MMMSKPFVQLFVTSLLFVVMLHDARAYNQTNQNTAPWLQILNNQNQPPIQVDRQYTASQLEYIKRLFHGLTLGSLSEDQKEEIEEYFDQQNEEQQQNQQPYQTLVQQQTQQNDDGEYKQPNQPIYNQQQTLDDASDEEECQGFKVFPGNVNYYLQFNGIYWIKRSCPYGLRYDGENCACVRLPVTSSTTTSKMTPTTTTTQRPTTTTTTTTQRPTTTTTTTTQRPTTTTTTTTQRPTTTTTQRPTTTTTTTTQRPTTTTTQRPTTTTTQRPTTTTTQRPTTTTTTTTTTTQRPTTTTTQRPTTTTTQRPTTTTTQRPTTTTTITTTRKTTTGKPSIDLCRDCVILHGVGYAPYPGHCDAYVQCLYYGDVPTTVNIRRCPTGLEWNQYKLTCDYPENVLCKPDVLKCPNQKPIFGDRQGYLIFNGYSWSQVRCPPSKIYNDITCDCSEGLEGQGNYETCLDKKAISGDRTGFLQLSPSGWIRMPCPTNLGYEPATCRCTEILEAFEYNTYCPNFKPIPGDKTGYFQFNGVNWIRMPCPASVGYDTRTCQCSSPLTGDNTGKDVCKPSLRLTFDDNSATDSSHNQFWVNNTGVTFSDGRAYFDGKSRLTVPGFSNMELGDTVFITIKYSQDGSNRQTLVTNGDCGVLQSVGLCSGPSSVDFYSETPIQQANVVVPKMASPWQYVMFSLYKDHLRGYVGTRSLAQEIKGQVTRRQRGLVIGAGGDCDSFTGAIDEINVFLCHPGFA